MSKLKKLLLAGNIFVVVVMPTGLAIQRGYETVEAKNNSKQELQDIKDHIMEIKLIPEEMKLVYDMNNDGKITSQDYLILKNE